MKIAIITAGGAGMYCGSCMQDNSLASSLLSLGHDVQLLPTYTPIRTDESDVSLDRVFFGGINVYLNHRFQWWHRIPSWLRSQLDRPGLIRLLAGMASTNTQELGGLTLSMLRGEHVRESDELVQYLVCQGQPDVVIFSNALLVGMLHDLKNQWSGPVYCLLQGDDIFTEGLSEPYRSQVLSLIREKVQQFDGFFVHSNYYKDFMSEYFEIEKSRFHHIPLGIQLDEFCTPETSEETHFKQSESDNPDSKTTKQSLKIGYFARVCPEKGFHQLVEALGLVCKQGIEFEFRVAGYVPEQHKEYLRLQIEMSEELGFKLLYRECPDRSSKINFLQSLDIFSVPTVYHEPKGIYVLEALASGVPVIQPEHGSFPELVGRTGGGLLVEPGNTSDLADKIATLIRDDCLREQLGSSGARAVSGFSVEASASALLQALDGAMFT